MPNLIGRIGSYLKSFTLTQKSYKQVPSESVGFRTGGSTYASTAKEIDMIKSWVYISLDMNARMIASTPLRLYAVMPEGYEPEITPVKSLTQKQHRALTTKGMTAPKGYKIVEILDHPSLELLHNVNAFRAYQSMMRETIWSMQGTGDAYWFVVRYNTGMMSGIPQEIWLLNPAKVEVVFDKKEFIKGYLYNTGNGRVAIPRENMVHFREPNLKSQFNGMGRIEAIWGAVLSYDSYQKYEIGNSRNPIPAVVVSIKGQSLSPAQRRELIVEYDRLISNQGGIIRSNVLGIEDDNVEFKTLSFNPKDMQFVEGRKWNREEITNAFGQSVALFTDNASRANVDGALYRWSKFELDPDCKLIASILTEQLLPMFNTNMKMFFEFDLITKEDEVIALSYQTADRAESIRSINEIREDRGLEPIDDERADDPFFASAQPMSLDSTSNAVNPNNTSLPNGLPNGSSGDNSLIDEAEQQEM